MARALRSGIVVVAALVGSLLIVLPGFRMRGDMFPPNWLIGRDSNVFLYGGLRILKGEVPYRDFWDHKSPGIFFVDALGVALGFGSLYGLVVLEYLVVAATLLMMFLVLRNMFGNWSAFGAMCFVIAMYIHTFWGGNLTEIYATCFISATMLATVPILNSSRLPENSRLILVGALAFMPAVFKANTAAMGLLLCAAMALDIWLKSDIRNAMKSGLFISLGVLLAIFPFIAFFAVHGALGDAWEGIIDYNFNYVQQNTDAEHVNWFSRWSSLERPINTVRLSLVPIVAPLGWLATWAIVSRKDRLGLTWMAWVVAISAPLLVLMTLMLSGRDYVYYYTAWLPAAAMSIAALLRWLTVGVERLLAAKPSSNRIRVVASILGAAVLLVIPTYSYMHPSMPGSSSRANFQRREGLMLVLERELDPGDSLLIWGNEPMFHVFSDFQQQNRFLYQYPLFFGPNREKYIEEFWADIEQNPPKIVIDTKTANTYMMPGFREGSGDEWERSYGEELPSEFESFRDLIHNCYQLVEIDNAAAEMLGWDVWKYTPESDSELCGRIAEPN